MISKYTKGMVYYIDLGNNYGVTVQQGRRPCIIVSNNLGNYFSDNVTVVPCTTSTSKTDLPTHLPVQVVNNVESLAICENVVTVSKRKCENFLGILDNTTMEKLDKCLAIALGISPDYPTELKANVKEAAKEATTVPTELKKPNKRGFVRINPDEMEQFIKDCDEKGTDYVMKKYQVKSKMAVSQRKNYYKNKLASK
jgi:mRNA interferase MazF